MNRTVKRKFNALLQGIGSNASSSTIDNNNTSEKRPSSAAGLDDPDGTHDSLNKAPSSSPSSRMANNSSEFLSKKRRVGAAPPVLVSSSTPTRFGSPQSHTTPSKGLTTISNVTLRKWAPNGNKGTGGEEAKDGQPPKYCPGDREQLLRRLATFQEITDWTPKPEAVNEVEWAKRGWVCQGKERVKCILCSREIFVKLNKKEVDGKEIAVMIASEIAQSVVDMYKEMIVTSHTEDCLWRRRGCDDSLLRLPITNPKLALEGLRQRYDELCDRKPFLPEESHLRLPESMNLDVILTYLPPNFFTEPPPRTNKAATPSSTTDTTPPTSPPNRSALALAVLGWQGLSNPRIGPVPNSASCHTCLRRLGLWMFQPKEIDPESHQILVPAPMDHLDALREHRFFCPWKNGQAQRNSGAKPNTAGAEQDKPGWEVLVQVLRNEAFIRQRTSTAHSRSKSSVPATPSGAGRSSLVPPGGGVQTPERRPVTAGGHVTTPPRQQFLGSPGMGGIHDGREGGEEEEEDEETKKKKDQAMMSRLRRVKSLFNTKAAGKLKRLGSSRPGTAHSTASKASKAGE